MRVNLISFLAPFPLIVTIIRSNNSVLIGQPFILNCPAFLQEGIGGNLTLHDVDSIPVMPDSPFRRQGLIYLKQAQLVFLFNVCYCNTKSVLNVLIWYNSKLLTQSPPLLSLLNHDYPLPMDVAKLQSLTVASILWMNL